MLPAFPWAVGAIALGQAVQVASGSLHPRAILLLSVTIACALVGVLSSRAEGLGRAAEPLMIVAIGAGLCLQLVNLALVPPAMYLDWSDLKGHRPFVAGVVVSAVLIGSLIAAPPRLSRWLFPAILGVFLAMGVWLIRASPDPLTDVYVVQRDSIAALLDGRNPYAITFPNIYGAGTPFYAPDMLADGRTRFGYVYAPLSLFLTLPGHLLGDFRYAQLGAMALSAALMAYAVPGRTRARRGASCSCSPRGRSSCSSRDGSSRSSSAACARWCSVRCAGPRRCRTPSCCSCRPSSTCCSRCRRSFCSCPGRGRPLKDAAARLVAGDPDRAPGGGAAGPDRPGGVLETRPWPCNPPCPSGRIRSATRRGGCPGTACLRPRPGWLSPPPAPRPRWRSGDARARRWALPRRWP